MFEWIYTSFSGPKSRQKGGTKSGIWKKNVDSHVIKVAKIQNVISIYSIHTTSKMKHKLYVEQFYGYFMFPFLSKWQNEITLWILVTFNFAYHVL